MHYQRQLRHGNPHFTLKSYGTGKAKEDQFWSKVDIKGDDECWEWLGCVNKAGYGYYGYDKKSVRVHRMSWFYKHNVWPKLDLLHSCDNKICVNTNHLKEGTQKENIQDMIERGRFRGGKYDHKGLTKEDVQEIKYGNTKLTLAEFGQKYSVHPSTISLILNGKRWGWV